MFGCDDRFPERKHEMRMHRGYLWEDNIWVERRRSAVQFAKGPALFVDRDGVLVEECEYLHRPEQIHLIDAAANVIAEANRARVPVVMVTNQAGIARGIFDWEQFAECNAAIVDEYERRGSAIDLILACPHHPKGRQPFQHPDHPMRKPNPGMVLRAAEILPIELGHSLIVGDKATDLAAGKAAGLSAGVHVMSGHGSEVDELKASQALADETFEISIVENMGALLGSRVLSLVLGRTPRA